MTASKDPLAHDDRGFTLIEVVMVTVIIGVVLTALAGAFTVIVRTTPSAEIRVDDARSTRGLATWLAHDTTSTPPFDAPDPKGWIDTSPGRNDCGGSGSNIVHFSWREAGFSTTTFVANYRYVDGRVFRYTCSTSSGTKLLKLTSGLDPTDPPDVIFKYSGPKVVAVDLVLHAASGEDVLIESSSRNPVEFYP